MARGRMKEIAVIGLGKFGRSVARAYSNEGGMVLAIDIDQEKVQEMSPFVTYAVRADVTEADVVGTLGLSNVDAVVVAITDNLEASVMATILSKEEGVPYVIAKAQSEIHARVLRKVGADKIVFPESEMGMRVARQLCMNYNVDLVDLSDDHSIVEVKTPEAWVGKSLMELDVRKNYSLNVIGYRYNNKIEVSMSASMPLQKDMLLIIIGENDKIDRVFNE